MLSGSFIVFYLSCLVLNTVVVLLFICVLSVILTQTGIILCTFTVFVSFFGVVSCYIYTFCFRVVTYRHMFICLEFIVHIGKFLRIVLIFFNFLCQSVWFSTTVCKEEVSSVVLILFITPMLKYYCSTNHQSCFSTMRVTLLPLSFSNVSSKFHRKCFVWVLQLGKRVVSSFWPTRCSAFPYCQKKSALKKVLVTVPLKGQLCTLPNMYLTCNLFTPKSAQWYLNGTKMSLRDWPINKQLQFLHIFPEKNS